MSQNELQRNSTEINDLTVASGRQTQIKGDPNPKNQRTLVLQTSATAPGGDMADLEPQGDVVGGILIGMLVPAVQKVR